jgi:mediator of RNA polymerase II transcription subunit 6
MERAGGGSGGEANKKQPGADGSQASTSAAGASGEPLPDADPDLIKKLEKERALTHPKKQQNTALLLNAMRTTAAHPFQMFHEREAAAATTITTTAAAELQHQLGTSSEGVASEGQRSSATPAPALMIPTQSAGSQSSYSLSASQDPSKGGVGAAKKKKKRMYFPLTRISNAATA